MPDKLKAGLIGCGGMGLRQLYGYLNCQRYEVVALADVRTEAMQEFDRVLADYDAYHPTHYEDASQMLDSEELDVVSVCTWHRGHAPWTIEAATRGVKAVLCEKPMAEDLGHAERMLAVCAANGVKLIVGHQRRFLPTYNMARELIAEGAIGEVHLIRSIAGDGLLNQSSHLMDMFRYVQGDVDCEWVMGSVERDTDRYERDTRVEDRALAVLGFKNGSRALLLSGLHSDFYQGGMIYGSDGMIDLFAEHLRLFNGDTNGQWKDRTPESRYSKPGESWYEYIEGGAAQADELADWIEGRTDTHRGEATHGYKAIEMALAVYESARLHERVTLPLKTRVNPLDVMVDTDHLPVRYPGKYDIRARPRKAR